MKPQTFWGGFSEGRLHVDVVDDFFGGSHHIMRPAIFRTRKEAREQYQDTRKVIIVEAKPKPPKPQPPRSTEPQAVERVRP